jgi:hypothetical protein
MKINTLQSVLVGALLLSSAVTAWLSVRHFFALRQLQTLQTTVSTVNRNRALVASLAKEAVEYGKRNPAIDPILTQFELKNPTNSNPKPPSK